MFVVYLASSPNCWRASYACIRRGRVRRERCFTHDQIRARILPHHRRPSGNHRGVSSCPLTCCCSLIEPCTAFRVIEPHRVANRNYSLCVMSLAGPCTLSCLVAVHDVGGSSQRVLREHPDYDTL